MARVNPEMEMAQPQQVFQVAVPPGTAPGTQMQVMAPNGVPMMVAIPAGELPGGLMTVAMPPAQQGVVMAATPAQPTMMQPMVGAMVAGAAGAVAGGAAMVAAGAAQVKAMMMGPQRAKGIAGMAQMLETTPSVKIEQKIHAIEAVSGGCCEQANEYKIMGGTDRSTHLFTAKEKSEGCDRVCCKPHNNLLLHINAADNDETMITLERKGMKCNCGGPKMCLPCCILSDACAEELIVHEGRIDGQAGNISEATKLSLIRQPAPWGGCFTPKLEVLNQQGAVDTVMEGPTCFGGWSELCCDASFVLKRGNEPVATIKHLAPKDPMQACAAACTDSDNFEVTFTPTTGPMDKANAIAAGLLVDFMFFEIDQGLCHCENGTLYCTLCLCYCAGCLIPCNCCISANRNGGGRPSRAEDAAGAPPAPDGPLSLYPREQLLPIQKEQLMRAVEEDHMHRD